MADIEIHKDDLGTKLVLAFLDQNDDPVDLTGLSSSKIIVKKPDGTVKALVSALEGIGTDGKISYTVLSSDSLFSPAGSGWEIQGEVTLSAAQVWRSSIREFLVQRNL